MEIGLLSQGGSEDLSGETGAKKFGGNYFSIDGSHSKIAFSASELSCTHLTIV
jgi:hypothetical protein